MAYNGPYNYDMEDNSGDDDSGVFNEQLWVRLEKLGKKISFAKDILALGRYLKDPNVSWHRKAIVGGALVYFLSPIDKVKDLKPLFGYLEELGVIEAVLKFLGNEIIPYYDPDYRE
ncbi:MAG: DUF1232 domain-containing protein [Ignavibacteria bacterium]